MKTAVIALAVPVSISTAALLSHLLFVHAPPTIATDLRQPVVVVTNWGAFGGFILATLFAACAAGTLALFVAARAGAASMRFVTAVCALSLVCAWAMPAILSSDVYAYAAYGELARHGANPYAHVPLDRGNPIFAAALWQWGDALPPCVYGPAFVAVAAAIVAATHALTTAATLDALRVAASLALPICGLLAFASYPGTQDQRRAAAATIALNPVAVWCAAEGHNDALALAAVLGGFALARRGKAAIGGFLTALAGTIKLPGTIAALPLALREPRARQGAIAGFASTLTLSLPLLYGVATELAPHGRFAPQASFEAIVKAAAWLVLKDDGASTVATWAIAAAAAAVFAARAVALLKMDRPEGWAYLAAGGWLLVPNPYPWYALWILPVAALAPHARANAALLWLPLASMLRYVPDAVGAPNPLGTVLLGIGATIPLAMLLLRFDGDRRTA